MKTLIVTLAAATALTAGAAAAQPYGYGRGGPDPWMSINQRQAMLERRIERGIERGDLTRREAYQARAAYNDIARLEVRYRRNGLSQWERQDLDRRFDALAAQIRWDRRDGDRRYGYNDYPRY